LLDGEKVESVQEKKPFNAIPHSEQIHLTRFLSPTLFAGTLPL
jgi:hypothetical protein